MSFGGGVHALDAQKLYEVAVLAKKETVRSGRQQDCGLANIGCKGHDLQNHSFKYDKERGKEMFKIYKNLYVLPEKGLSELAVNRIGTEND